MPGDLFYKPSDQWPRCSKCRRYVVGTPVPASPALVLASPPVDPGSDACGPPGPPPGSPSGGGGAPTSCPGPGPSAGSSEAPGPPAGSAPADSAGPSGTTWNTSVEPLAPPPPPVPGFPLSRAARTLVPPSRVPAQSWIVVQDVARLGAAGWAMVWSQLAIDPKMTFLLQRWHWVSQFIREVTGNDHWTCPLCKRGTVVDGSHWSGRKHVQQVWYELEAVNMKLGLPSSTYTNAAYSSRSLWAFKVCQPSSHGSYTAAISMLDGACYLLEELGEDGFNSLGSANAHWVSFLDTAMIPSQVTAAGLPLAIEFG